jgi:hypothetical protein
MQSNSDIVRGVFEKVLNLGDIDAAGSSSARIWSSKFRGTFLGVPATGRPVTSWGIVIDRLEGGKIKDTRIIMDTLGLMIQLGAVPPPNA